MSRLLPLAAILASTRATSAPRQTALMKEQGAAVLAEAMRIRMEDHLYTPEARTDFGVAGAEALAATRHVEKRVEETFVWAAPERDPAEVRAGIARMGFLPTILPKQSIREAALAFQDFAEPRVEQLLHRTDAALDRVDDLLGWLGGPGLQVIADEEREAMMAAVDKQRLAVAELVAAERDQLTAFVARERGIVLEELRKKRVAATQDVRRLARAATDDASRSAKEVVDDALVRAALLVAGAILLWGAVTLLVRRALPAGPRASGSDAIAPADGELARFGLQASCRAGPARPGRTGPRRWPR